MSTAYFYKELVSNPVRLSNGKTVGWEAIGEDEGILKTENEWLAGELRSLAQRRILGVIEIPLEEYESKKNSGAPVSPPRPRLTDPPRYPEVRLDSRGTPPVAADTVLTIKPAAETVQAAHVHAIETSNAPPADPSANRPATRKVSKTQPNLPSI